MLASYAVATVIGPTPIPSFVILPAFAVGFLVAALFVSVVRPRRGRFVLTVAIVMAAAVYGGSLLLYGPTSVRSTATHGFFVFVLVAILLGGGTVWLAEVSARFARDETRIENTE